jgi:hypothetical protein
MYFIRAIKALKIAIFLFITRNFKLIGAPMRHCQSELIGKFNRCKSNKVSNF